MLRIAAAAAAVALLVASSASASDVDGTKFATGWVSALPMATGMCNYTNLNDGDVNVEITGIGGASTLGYQTFYSLAPHESASIAFTVPAWPVTNRSFLCKFEAELVAGGDDPVAACNATSKRPNGEQHAESDCQRLTAAAAAEAAPLVCKRESTNYSLTFDEEGDTSRVASCSDSGDIALDCGWNNQRQKWITKQARTDEGGECRYTIVENGGGNGNFQAFLLCCNAELEEDD